MRKKISISLATAFLMISGSAYADGNITGTVFNKTTSEPLDFATVVLVKAETGALLPIGTTTDENGVFIIPNAPSGKYIVRVSMIGNVTQEREITIGNSEINLGKIELAEDTKLLQEVVVTGQKSQLSVNAERRIFNVSSNIAATGASADELLAARIEEALVDGLEGRDDKAQHEQDRGRTQEGEHRHGVAETASDAAEDEEDNEQNREEHGDAGRGGPQFGDALEDVLPDHVASASSVLLSGEQVV